MKKIMTQHLKYNQKWPFSLHILIKALFCCLVTLFANVSWTADYNGRINDVEHISTQQGLSQNSVNYFYEDDDGYIWIATKAGLNRFDGESILKISGENKQLDTSSINHIFKDDKKNLWVSTNQGLSYVSKDQKNLFNAQFPSKSKNQKKANKVIGVETLNKNTVLVFTWNGAYQYKNKGRDIIQVESMSIFHSLETHLLSFQKEGAQFWLGSNVGLHLFNSHDSSLLKIPTYLNKVEVNLVINSIDKLNEENIVINTTTGLYLVNVHNLKNLQLEKITKQSVSAVSIRNKKIFYANKQAIRIFDIETKKNKVLIAIKDVAANNKTKKIKTIYVDSRQILWLGTENQGAYYISTKTNKFSLWNSKKDIHNQALNSDIVLSINQDENNNLLIGTNKGLNYFQFKKNKIISLIDNETAHVNNKTLEINDSLKIQDNIWAASSDGLIQYNLKSGTSTLFKPNFSSSDKAFSIYQMASSNKNEFFLASNLGLMKLNIGKGVFSFKKSSLQLINNSATKLIKFRDGLFWISVQGKLLTYSPKSKISTLVLPPKKDIRNHPIEIIDFDIYKNKLWLTYKNSGVDVFSLKKGKASIIKQLNISSGFPENNIFSLAQYSGDILVSSSLGIIKVNSKTYQHTLFKQSNDLANAKFNPRATLVDDLGNVFYGTNKGLLKVNVHDINIHKINLETRISSVKISSKDSIAKPILDNVEQVNLIDNTDIIDISISTLQFVPKKPVIYEYWLEGKKESSVKRTKYPFISLTEFPKGQTELNIRSLVLGTGAISKTTKLIINTKNNPDFVLPASFESYLIVVLIIVWFYYRRNLNNKKSSSLYKKIAENEERLELALLDKKRGIWDCYIDQDDIQKSIFIIYQYQQQPLRLTLEKFISLIHKDDIEKTKRSWTSFELDEQPSFSQTYRIRYNNHWVWNRTNGKVNELHPSGFPKRATGTWSDISAEKQTEEKLTLYSHAFQSTQNIVFILDKKLKIIVVNNAYEKLTGFKSNSLIGKNMVEIAFSRFTKQEAEKIHQLLDKNKSWRGKSSVPRKNSTSYSVDIRINTISENNVEQGYVVVMNDISQMKPLEKPIIDSGFYDQLTGLPNKVLAFDRLRQLLEHCKNNQQRLSVIFLGIENFSSLKKILEQETINQLIMSVSNRLLPYIQKDDLLARYEQNVFIIILRHNNESSLPIITKILNDVSRTFIINDQPINIDTCVGISNFPDDSDNWNQLVTNAQVAQADAQQQENFQFKYFNQLNHNKAVEKVKLENRLKDAINHRELYLVFQPVIDLKNSKIVELDINMRWKLDDKRIVYPSQFLPIANTINCLTTIMDWLVNQSLSALSRWNQEGFSCKVNLNLSSSYLFRADAINNIKEKITFHGINPNDVFISILEEELNLKGPKLAKTMQQLNAFGIQIILDSFGEKSANLQHLQDFNFYAVKLDRVLIRNIPKTQSNNKILLTLISLLNQLNIKSIAKGIETREQLDFLIKDGCQFGQGFIFSDPLIENEMHQYMLKNKA